MTRRRAVRSEHALHRAVAAYLAAVLPADAFWTTFPAGSGGKARGGQLKAAGLRPGVPDLILLYRGRFLGIELKSAKGRVSDAQQACRALILAAGGAWAECRSLDDIELALTEFRVPLRGRVRVA